MGHESRVPRPPLALATHASCLVPHAWLLMPRYSCPTPDPAQPTAQRTRPSALIPRPYVSAITPDGLDGTVVHRVLAERFFVGRFGLFVDEGEACLVVAHEVCGGSLTTEVAVDALRIDVVAAGRLAGHLIVRVCHPRVCLFSCGNSAHVQRAVRA